MALTAAQLSYLRDATGDDCEPYEIADATIQAIYDDTTQGASDLNKTIVWMLRRLLGKFAKLTVISNDFGTTQSTIRWQQTKALLELWEGITGLGGAGIVTASVLDLDLDEPCPEGVDCNDEY